MISEEVKTKLVILEIGNFNKLPKLKDICSAFLKRSKEFHPDKNVHLNDEQIKEKEEKFKILLGAYKELAEMAFNNEELADEYDEEEERARTEFEEMKYKCVFEKGTYNRMFKCND